MNQETIPVEANRSHNQGRFDLYLTVTNLIIGHLERGVVPWRCPWSPDAGRPCNFHTGKAYRGVNVLLLGLQDFTSPYWMTFRQVKERGGSVRKDEHGSLVVKYGRHRRQFDGSGAEESTEKTGRRRSALFLKGYKVFNSAQIDGIDFPQGPLRKITAAETIVEGMPNRPEIREGRSGRACYRPVSDTVEMPDLSAFKRAEDFHLTLFHELVHATGHQKRLNRKSAVEHDGFGGKVYSLEELVAEMGAAFLASEAGIVQDNHEMSAAYLDGWLEVLQTKEHRRWIVQASADAGKAVDFILGANGREEAEHGEEEAIEKERRA